jgi:hypothetical protein
MKILRQKAPKSVTKTKGGRTNGSDFSSARGSEERHASVAAQSGRGPRRNRDYEIEQVCFTIFSCLSFVFSFEFVSATGFCGSEFTSRHPRFLHVLNSISLLASGDNI